MLILLGVAVIAVAFALRFHPLLVAATAALGAGMPFNTNRYATIAWQALPAIGVLAGFCGALLTPLAANFNLVPAALLQLKDRYGVIRASAPTAVLMLVVNMVLMNVLAFRV